MKIFIAVAFLFSTLIVQKDVEAQVRGPRYNPNPRGPRYNPNPGPVVTRPAPTGPRYNPRPAPIPGHRPVGPRYGRSYDPGVGVPTRVHYGSRYYTRPYGYNPLPYNPYYHSPYRAPYFSSVRYFRTYDWYTYVYRSYPNYVYAHWVFWPTAGYNNGYWTIDNYPYYVFNGYRYRYSTIDYCNYQLVDSYDHRVQGTYWNQLCNTGYDACAFERDRLNSQMGEYRYFCSETWRDYDFDYSTPSYETTNYENTHDQNTCLDYNQNGTCDDYENTSSNCNDYDKDGYCDVDNYITNGTEI